MVYDYYYDSAWRYSSPYRYSYYDGYAPRYYRSGYYSPYYADTYYGTRYYDYARAYDGTLTWRGLYDADRYYSPSRLTWRRLYEERDARDGQGEEIKVEKQEKGKGATPSKAKPTAAEESGDDNEAPRTPARLTWRGLYDYHYTSPRRLSWGGLYSRYHSPYYYGRYYDYGYYGSPYRSARYYTPRRTTTYVDYSPSRTYTTYRRTYTAY